MATTHRLELEPNKKGGRDKLRHHHRVGVGHPESTPLETALPARTVGASRPSVKKCVAERGSRSKDEVFRDHERPRLSDDPTLSEAAG